MATGSSPQFEYNIKYYDGIDLGQLRPRAKAFKTYKTKDGTVIGLFQGKRGEKPELDFVIKVLLPGVERRPIRPPHTFWVVGLLLANSQYQKEICDYYLAYYETAAPFSLADEWKDYKFETLEEIVSKYENLEPEIPFDYIAMMMELFCRNEMTKRGSNPSNVYMFKNLLLELKKHADGKSHYMDVLQAAMPKRRRS